MRRALSTRTRSNISASRELRGGVKWAMAIQAMRPAPGSRTNAAPGAANEYTTVPAVQRTRQKSVASGGGSHHGAPVDVRSEASIRPGRLGGGPHVRVVGGGQKQTRRHPLWQEEDVPHLRHRGVQRLLSLRHEADWLGDRVGAEKVLLSRVSHLLGDRVSSSPLAEA